MEASSPSNALTAYQRLSPVGALEPTTCSTRCRAFSTWSEKCTSGAGAVLSAAAFLAAATSLSTPSPRRAETSTTGQPKSTESLAGSTLSPFLRTRSHMLRATTMGRPSSSSWVVR